MAKRRNASSVALAIRTAELALAVPQVVFHRTARMVLAGSAPSARDRREFARMTAEKAAAYTESWSAMALSAWRANQALAGSWFSMYGAAARGVRPSLAGPLAKSRRGAIAVLGTGLAPVHRRAVANAKRLAKTRLR